MVKVKICGIRLEKEIEAINKVKPDFAGFVFSASKRRVNVLEAKILISKLDPSIIPVAVVRNLSLYEMVEIVCACGIKIIQLHGHESPSQVNYVKELSGAEVWKAINMPSDLHRLSEYNRVADHLLFDGPAPGTGQGFDYDLIDDSNFEMILAGGLNTENVSDAILKLRPYCVDVSSGVEGLDGFKDLNLINSFVNATRASN